MTSKHTGDMTIGHGCSWGEVGQVMCPPQAEESKGPKLGSKMNV